MALIQCPECEGKVSDKAAACPHCGCPITTKQPPARLLLSVQSHRQKCGSLMGLGPSHIRAPIAESLILPAKQSARLLLGVQSKYPLNLSPALKHTTKHIKP